MIWCISSLIRCPRSLLSIGEAPINCVSGRSEEGSNLQVDDELEDTTYAPRLVWASSILNGIIHCYCGLPGNYWMNVEVRDG